MAIWHTLASGATVGWEGLGGVTRFYYDAKNDVLYMPDLRGMFRAMAGDGVVAPSMGGVAGDRARLVWGFAGTVCNEPNGAFWFSALTTDRDYRDGASKCGNSNMDTGRIVPTGATFAPRSWGALACCYLGHLAA